MEFIPYGMQWIDEEDINEVANVLRSNWITTGPKIKEFEDDLLACQTTEYCLSMLNRHTSELCDCSCIAKATYG